MTGGQACALPICAGRGNGRGAGGAAGGGVGGLRLGGAQAPPPPTVAPTRVPTVHSLPPSLLLPLPVSLLYTHSLPPSLVLALPVSLLHTRSLAPYGWPYLCPYCTLTHSLSRVVCTCKHCGRMERRAARA